jgi:hypothetical protein
LPQILDLLEAQKNRRDTLWNPAGQTCTKLLTDVQTAQLIGNGLTPVRDAKWLTALGGMANPFELYLGERSVDPLQFIVRSAYRPFVQQDRCL